MIGFSSKGHSIERDGKGQRGFRGVKIVEEGEPTQSNLAVGHHV